MEMIRWGIIGCGDVTEVKSGPAFQYAERSRLVAVMRRTADRAEDYARRHGVPRWYSDVDRLISDAEVDAVYIATPPGNHLESALRVCAAGKPAYVEKPLARNHTEAKTMVQAFQDAGLKLYAAYYRRALPRFLKVKAALDAATIGTLTGLSYRYAQPFHREVKPATLPWRLQVEHSGGGLFMDLGCHTLDLFDFFFGPLADVRGRAANRASDYAVEDTVSMEFVFGDGALGTASWNFAGGVTEDRIEITGTEGRICCSTFGAEPVEITTRHGEESFPFKNPYHIQQPLVQTVVDDLLGRGACPSSGETAARTSLVMDTVLAGYYGGRDDAFWSRRGSSHDRKEDSPPKAT